MRHMATAVLTAWLIGGCTFDGFAAVLLASVVQRLREVRS